jgi:hypothetical protein
MDYILSDAKYKFTLSKLNSHIKIRMVRRASKRIFYRLQVHP